MGNARMILNAEVPEGNTVTIEKTIKVNNVNEVPISVVLEPETKSNYFINVIDTKFVLQPGESANAKFQIILKSGGDYSGKVLVSFYAADPTLSDPPIGLSSTIIVHAEGPVNQFYYDYLNYTGNDPNADGDDTGDSEFNNSSVTDDTSINQSNNNQPNTITGAAVTPAGKKPNAWIGAILIAVIVILGIAVFLVIFTLKED
jgi:hypothetical protein